MNEKDWLDAATAKIRFSPDRKAVRRELEAHLEDLREASGLEEDAALKAMGDPAGIAEELGRLHRPWWGYLWRTSQVILLLTAVACGLMAFWVELLYQPLGRMERERQNYQMLYSIAEAPEEREIAAGMSVKTGGYTIMADRAVLRKYDAEEGRWTLYVDLQIDLGWRREPLSMWNAWSGARSSEGPIRQLVIERNVSWAFRQKACAAVDVPEDAEWVELDFGYGELLRTMRIDLTKEADG